MRFLTCVPIASVPPMIALNNAAEITHSRQFFHAQYPASSRQGYNRLPGFANSTMAQSRVADCPARPLMARNRLSSQSMMTIMPRWSSAGPHPSYMYQESFLPCLGWNGCAMRRRRSELISLNGSVCDGIAPLRRSFTGPRG